MGKNGAIPEPGESVHESQRFVGVRYLVPRSLNCEYFSIFPPGGLLMNSRYNNVRSNVGIIYKEGHVNVQKKVNERGMKVLIRMHADARHSSSTHPTTHLRQFWDLRLKIR